MDYRFRTLFAPTIPALIAALNEGQFGLGRVIYIGINDAAVDTTDAVMAVVDVAFIPVITHEDYMYLQNGDQPVFEADPEFPITLSA